MKRDPSLEGCFGCGSENEMGLKLEFHWEGEDYVAPFTAQECHRGYPGVVHGGIIASVLDEAMGRLLWEERGGGPTRKLTVEYLAPLVPGEQTLCRARIVQKKGRAVFLEAELLRNGDQVAAARGTYII